MSAGTIKTDIYTICNTSPCRISRLTIKARLVSKKFSWVQIKQIEQLTLLPFCALSTLKNSSVSCFVGSAIGSNGPGALGLFLVCDSDLMWLNQVSEVTVLGVGTSETRKPFEGEGECRHRAWAQTYTQRQKLILTVPNDHGHPYTGTCWWGHQLRILSSQRRSTLTSPLHSWL